MLKVSIYRHINEYFIIWIRRCVLALEGNNIWAASMTAVYHNTQHTTQGFFLGIWEPMRIQRGASQCCILHCVKSKPNIHHHDHRGFNSSLVLCFLLASLCLLGFFCFVFGGDILGFSQKVGHHFFKIRVTKIFLCI